jgi:hypothetical protein
MGAKYTMKKEIKMEKKTSLGKFIWQITYAHTIGYFIAGVFAIVFLNYKELFNLDIYSGQVRSLDDPLVALGPGLQIFRGLILGLVLLPFRKTIFDEKHGLLKLGLLVLGLSVISTYSGGMGSFDGFIYNKLPIKYQIHCYPEAILWILSFIGILAVSKKYEQKNITTVLSIIFTAVICLSSIMGFLLG